MEHPIQGLLKTAMESIKDMVDVNTIIGDAVETANGTVIIPISRVSFGFAAGGANGQAPEGEEEQTAFGGGSGAGVSVKPVGFLVCTPHSDVRFMAVEGNQLYERLVDLIPKVLSMLQEALQRPDTAKPTADMDDK